MTNQPHTLLEELIAIPSDPDRLDALDQILELALSKLSAHTIERFEHGGVKSALVYNRKERPETFKVILNAHLDVIPAKKEQYVPRVDGGRMYGAGAMDMKAGVASFISVFNELANKVPYPLALQLTTDEEVGGFKGTKYQIEQGVRAEFVLAGEPTNLEIVHKAKGILQAKITARGETAHGAYPWRGDNALWKLHDCLAKLKEAFPIPAEEVWQTTLNLSMIDTPNRAFNKVPDVASAMLDIRFVAEDEQTVKRKVENCLGEGCDMEVVFFEPAMDTAPSNPYVEQLKQATQEAVGKTPVLRGANGSSDARHYAPQGAGGVEFGPVGGGIGSDDEWVDVASIEVYCQIITKFLQNIQK